MLVLTHVKSTIKQIDADIVSLSPSSSNTRASVIQSSGSPLVEPQPSHRAPAPTPLFSLHPEPPSQQTQPRQTQSSHQQSYNCNDCRYRCQDLRNLDRHIAAKHRRPHHIPDLTLLVGDSSMKTVNCRAVEAGLGGGKLVCGEHVALQPSGRRSPRAGKPGRAYNSVGSWPNAKYSKSSLETVVPQLLAQTKSTISNLVVQSPTSDLTNLRGLPQSDHRALVLQSAGNVMWTMEKALSDNPSLRKGVVMGQLPRKDDALLSTYTELYNTTLQQLAATSDYRNKLVVVGHPSLAPTTKEKTTKMFGSPSSPRSDGIQFRGSEGSRRHTDSVVSALRSAGLAAPAVPAEWRTQGRRGAARLHPSGNFSQVVETGNTFQPLNC